MALSEETAGIGHHDRYGAEGLFQYRISGLPEGEQAVIAQFPEGWRILRWNNEWHGNWSGVYMTVEAALEALREQTSMPVGRLSVAS